MPAIASQNGPCSGSVPPRRVIRDKQTHLYYRPGGWTADCNLAQNFVTWSEPRELTRSLPDKDLEIVLWSNQFDEISVPISELVSLDAGFRESRP